MLCSFVYLFIFLYYLTCSDFLFYFWLFFILYVRMYLLFDGLWVIMLNSLNTNFDFSVVKKKLGDAIPSSFSVLLDDARSGRLTKEGAEVIYNIFKEPVFFDRVGNDIEWFGEFVDATVIWLDEFFFEEKLKDEVGALKEPLATFRNYKIYSLSPEELENFPMIKKKLFMEIETSFSRIGGGTWNDIKTDEYNKYFSQLFVVNNQLEIIGGYRFLVDQNLSDKVSPVSDRYELANVEDGERVLELGTAWSVDTREKLFALASTWVALAKLMVINKQDYFMGKLTIPADYDKDARNLMIIYLEKHFSKNKNNSKNGSAGQPKELFEYKMNKWEQNKKNKYLELLTKTIGKFVEDKQTLIDLFISFWEKRFPGMFGEYLKKIDNLEYFWTTESTNKKWQTVFESAILVGKLWFWDGVNPFVKAAGGEDEWYLAYFGLNSNQKTK